MRTVGCLCEPSPATFLSTELVWVPWPDSLSPYTTGKSFPYLLHLLLAHAKLVVAKQKGPDVLANLVLHASIVNLPQQLQLLVVLRDPGNRDCAVPAVTL